MSQTSTPVGKKHEKINKIREELIGALSSRQDTSETNISDMIAYVEMACDDEELALLVSRIEENKSKIADLDLGKRNISVLDNPAFVGLYGRNLTAENRDIVRSGLVAENDAYFAFLRSENIDYSEIKDTKDYLTLRVEREDKETGKKTLESPYRDLRKYQDAQITSNVLARMMYYMVIDETSSLDSMLGNETIEAAARDVIRAMHLDDLMEVVDKRKNVTNIILDESLLNEDGEIYTGTLNKDFFKAILDEIDLETEIDNEEGLNSASLVQANIDDDDFGIIDEPEFDDD